MSKKARWLVRCVAAALALWGFVIEPQRLVVHEQAIDVPGWPSSLAGLRVVALSDLHVGGTHMSLGRLRRVVTRANDLQPDAIVLLGDFVAMARLGLGLDKDTLGEVLGGLHTQLGVFAVLGNHDWRDRVALRRALVGHGITVVDDAAVPIVRGGARVWLVGIPDFSTEQPHMARILDRSNIPVGEPIVCLTHDPDVFPQVPPRVALTLAGHTHGGRVRLPFVGSLVVPSLYGQRYVAGLVEEAGHQLFVTTGVGTSIVPVRFGVTPELALLTLR